MFTHYLKMFWFAACLLFGLQIPGFVDQYGKALLAHQAESARAIAPFIEDSKLFFQGDLQKLWQHYLSQKDPVIQNGGKNIKQLDERYQQLTIALKSFNESKTQAYWQTFWNPIVDVRSEVWANYTFVVPFTQDTLIFAFIFALVVSLLSDGVLGFIIRLFKSNKKLNRSNSSSAA